MGQPRPYRLGHRLTLLGHVVLVQDPAAARDYYVAALALGPELGDKRRLANVLNGLAVLYQSQGDLEALRQYLSEAEPPVTETILRHVLRQEIPEYLHGAAPRIGGRQRKRTKRGST